MNIVINYKKIIILLLAIIVSIGIILSINASALTQRVYSIPEGDSSKMEILGIEDIRMPEIKEEIHSAQYVVNLDKLQQSLNYLAYKKKLESEKKAAEAKRIAAELAKKQNTNIPLSATSTEVIQLIRNKFGTQAENAIRVANCESGLRSNAVGDTYPINGIHAESIGVFQIRLLAGRPSKEWLLNATNNIDYAYNMYKSQGWGPWSCAKKLGIY